MMNTLETTVNGLPFKAFGAELLEYKVGQCSYKNGYMLPSGRMVPVKLNAKVGLRTVTLTMDFEGDEKMDVSLAISKLTAILHAGADIVLPDGFHYLCMYDKASTPEEVAPWIMQVTFTLSGVRRGTLQTKKFTASGIIVAAGNYETPEIVKLTPSVGSTSITFCGITITNVDGPVTIDGVNTTVKDEDGNNIYGSTDMTEWPKLQPGSNNISFTGASEVEVGYYPIYL